MKSWLAPIAFASSLSKGQGNVPVLSERNYTPDSRRDIHTSLLPSQLFSSLNVFSIVLMVVIFIVLILIVIIIILVRRFLKKHRLRKNLRYTNPAIEDKRGKNDR